MRPSAVRCLCVLMSLWVASSAVAQEGMRRGEGRTQLTEPLSGLPPAQPLLSEHAVLTKDDSITISGIATNAIEVELLP